MDSREHGPPPRAVGSISRLPIMHRASRDNLRRAASPTKDDPLRSTLPRFSNRYGASKIVPPRPLGESLNRSVAGKYGDANQSSSNRNRSPVRDALQAAQAAALETTPPSSTSEVPVFDDNDENPLPQNKPPHKRKPRPSLTERTLETLAQIPPSPSPTRRRASVISNGQMGPPVRPASSLRGSRPTTPSGSRPSSPNKQPFKPPGRTSPTKGTTLPAVPSPGSLFSPPRAFVKGGSLRPPKSISSDLRSVSTSTASAQSIRTPTNYSAKTMRAKPSSHQSAHKTLESMFKDPVKQSAPSNRLAVEGSPSGSGLLKPRSRGENVIASSPAKAKSERNRANSSKPISSSSEPTPQPTSHLSPPKSSAALRETIASAKAARRSAGSSIKPSDRHVDTQSSADTYVADDMDLVASNQGLLKQRIKGATSSGVLNISAMRLNSVPDAVMKMYDEGDSTVTWSETVDLIKFNAADNEIEEISDEVFPDWSVEEMADDDEKSNQFGGLEGLDLHNNLLHELPIGLRRLERLTNLNLSGNKLSQESLKVIFQMPCLHELNLSRNAFSGEFGLTGLQSLRSLNVRENRIEIIDIAQCQLRNLDVSNNHLRHLPWQTLSTLPLVQLNVSSNKLDGEGFEGVTQGYSQLRDLTLSGNAFSSLGSCVSSFSEMQICQLSTNQLSELPDFSGCRSLVTLQVSENQLSDLPSGLTELNELRNVDISHNNIKAIDPNLARLESLVSLELVGNPLRDRKFLKMDTADLKHELQKRLAADDDQASGVVAESSRDVLGTAYADGSGSRILYKPSNGILDLTSKSLTEIDISRIDLESASPPIHTLRISNNELAVLPVELLSHPALKWSLRSLDISHNPQLHPTEYLTKDLFLPVLRSLYVVSTGLTSLDALTGHLKAPELSELNISCHRLAGHVPWIRAWFPSCTALLASDNWFSSIDVEAVRGLEVLDIRNNQIEELPRGIGLLGNHAGKTEAGRLRVFECGGNKFRVPRIVVVEKGTQAVLKDLRRMVNEKDVPEEWKDEI